MRNGIRRVYSQVRLNFFLVLILTLRRRKGPGTAGDLVAISEPNIILIDSESSNVTQIGTWSRVEESEAVGGSYLQSNTANSKLTFSFKGSTLWIRFRFGPDCGKVKVEVDSLSVTIDLYYALELYKYVNIAVGLKENETHNVTLTVLGEKNASSTDYYVRVDSFAYRLTEEALSLHSIEYIDLINTINTINRINQIELINSITNVSSINTIDTINKIADAPWIANLGIAMNGDFETGNLAGWIDPAGVATVTDAHPNFAMGSKYSCNLKSSSYGIVQLIYPPRALEDIVECSVFQLAENPDTEQLKLTFFLTDGTHFGFTVAKSDVANSWQHKDLWPQIQDYLQITPSLRKKFFYAFMLSNVGSTDGLYIDKFQLVTIPSEWKQRGVNLRDVNATVAAGASGETTNAGIVKVIPGQILCISLEYASSASLFATETKFQVRVTLRNSNGSINETLSFTPPERPGTSYTKYNCYLIVPSGVTYVGVHGYLNNAETSDITIYMRNIKVYPVFDKPSKDVSIRLNNASISGGGSQDIDIDVPEWATGCAVTVRATYDASANAGVKFEVYSSPDGISWDTNTDDEFTLPFIAGETVQKTEIVAVGPPNVRIRVTNLDSTHTATVSLWTTFI